MSGDHIKTFRLFDQAEAEVHGDNFEFLDWEQEHYRVCSVCQELRNVFAKQAQQNPWRSLPKNGDINTTNGYFRSLCCGLETYVPAGKTFPDCSRHRNLSTAWKYVRGDSTKAKTQDSPAA